MTWRWVALAVLSVACHNDANRQGLAAATPSAKTPKLVATAPSTDKPHPDCTALEALRSGKMPQGMTTDPGKFWLDLETCLADGKPLCERAWALLMALPSMASPTADELVKQKAAYIAACNTLSEPIQRCLTAYGFAHPQECKALRAREQLNALWGGR